MGADAIFGYDHFHRPATVPSVDGLPQLLPEQPDVANFEGWTALSFTTEIHPTEAGTTSPTSRT